MVVVDEMLIVQAPPDWRYRKPKWKAASLNSRAIVKTVSLERGILYYLWSHVPAAKQMWFLRHSA